MRVANVFCGLLLGGFIATSENPESPQPREARVYGAWEWIPVERKSPPFGGIYRGHHVLILRDSVFEMWVKDQAALLLIGSGPLHISTSRSQAPKVGLVAIREWDLTLEDQHYRGSLSMALDTLVLSPLDTMTATHKYTRYYEPQIPTWTVEPQLLATAHIVPGSIHFITGSSGVEKVDTLTIEPESIGQVLPAYPPYARDAGIEGDVHTHVLVGVDGRIKNVKVVKSVTGLSEAAINAAKGWRFRPVTLDGEPVAVYIRVVFSFRLR